MQPFIERQRFVRFKRHFRTLFRIAIPQVKPTFPMHPARKELWQTRDARRPAKERPVSARSIGNKILASLTPSDFALLKPDLENVELPIRRQLELRGRAIDYVYFLETGLASMVVGAGANHNIEVAIVGREGMTGLPVLMGVERATHETFIQAAGRGWRLASGRLSAAMEQSPSLQRTLLRYVHTLVTQMAYTSLANGRYTIEERLARWLLMANDRADGDTIRLTHEFLALMLGTRRAGVTKALNDFQKRGVLRAARGCINIQNRSALEEAANGSYGAPEAEYQRVLGVN